MLPPAHGNPNDAEKVAVTRSDCKPGERERFEPIIAVEELSVVPMPGAPPRQIRQIGENEPPGFSEDTIAFPQSFLLVAPMVERDRARD